MKNTLVEFKKCDTIFLAALKHLVERILLDLLIILMILMTSMAFLPRQMTRKSKISKIYLTEKTSNNAF